MGLTTGVDSLEMEIWAICEISILFLSNLCEIKQFGIIFVVIGIMKIKRRWGNSTKISHCKDFCCFYNRFGKLI